MYTVRVFSIENGNIDVETILRLLREFALKLNAQVGDRFEVDFLDGNSENSEYLGWVSKVVHSCSEKGLPAHGHVLMGLRAFAENKLVGGAKPIDYFVGYFGSAFAREIRLIFDLNQIPTIHIPCISEKHLYFSCNKCCLEHPDLRHGEAFVDADLAVLTRAYPEIVYHELLHLFGVSDGYNVETRSTLQNCDPHCWMQYEPCKGRELCNYHLNQLKVYLNNHSGLK